jgi:transcriptional regulator with XRE-family HTH domain
MIGDNLRAIRQAKGVSIRALAEIVGVSKSTIVNIETGKFSPRYDIVERIAEALGAEIEIK